MSIFILVLFFIFIVMLVNIDRNIKNRKWFVLITFSILTSIAMIRSWTVGVDTEQYYRNFQIIASLGWDQVDVLRYEPGYFYLNKILSCISKDPHILIIVSSIIIIPSVGRIIYKYSKNVALSTFLYITLNAYFFQLTGMRQALAIAVILYGIDFFEKQKYLKFILVIILACMFHSSAIFLSVLILLQKMKYTKKTYINSLIVAIIGFIFYKQIFRIASLVIDKYAGYEESVYAASNYFGALFQFLVGFILYSVCHYLIFKMKENKKIEESEVGKISLRCLSVAVCIQLITMKMNILGRMTPYFWIFSIIAVPEALSYIKSKRRKEWILGIALFTFIYWLIIATMRPEWHGIIPYSTLFKD